MYTVLFYHFHLIGETISLFTEKAFFYVTKMCSFSLHLTPYITAQAQQELCKGISVYGCDIASQILVLTKCPNKDIC